MIGIGKVAAAAGLGFALYVSPALGQADVLKHAGPPGPSPRCGERLVTSLALTAEQQATLDALREETAEAIEPLFDELHSLREQIDEAASATSAEPCAVGALEIEAAGVHGKIRSLRQAAEARFVASLTAEQKARYEQHAAMHPDCLAVGGGFFFKRLP